MIRGGLRLKINSRLSGGPLASESRFSHSPDRSQEFIGLNKQIDKNSIQKSIVGQNYDNYGRPPFDDHFIKLSDTKLTPRIEGQHQRHLLSSNSKQIEITNIKDDLTIVNEQNRVGTNSDALATHIGQKSEKIVPNISGGYPKIVPTIEKSYQRGLNLGGTTQLKGIDQEKGQGKVKSLIEQFERRKKGKDTPGKEDKIGKLEGIMKKGRRNIAYTANSPISKKMKKSTAVKSHQRTLEDIWGPEQCKKGSPKLAKKFSEKRER